MKKGAKVEILDYYYNKNFVGKKGIVTNIHHDKDCIYAQTIWAKLKFEDNKTLIIPTCFIREVV